MTSAMIDHFRKFRQNIFQFFKYRSDSTLDLIDAIAGQSSKESVVKLSLCSLFRRGYSSITDVVDNLFRRKPNTDPTPEELKEDQLKVTQMFAQECPKSSDRRFALFATDCTSNSRVYAEKLEDRSFVHQPTKVPGQKPITVGHEFSCLVYLPEKTTESDFHWIVPLSIRRVKAAEVGTLIGMEQIIEVVTKTEFKDQLCVLVNDSAYSSVDCVEKTKDLPNLIQIARLRNNRVFNLQVDQNQISKPGRPKIYGDRWALNDPGESDECCIIYKTTGKGRKYLVKIERWNNRLEHGNFYENKVLAIEFDAVRVTVLKEDATPLYKKPLWLMITGKRRKELTLQEICDSYFQRYDIEHFFRFGKQKLLLTSFQTADVKHEENWWWLCMMSYMMLFQCRFSANHNYHAWEKYLQKSINARMNTPAQVQRSYERIIRESGTPARSAKPRGKSSGRVKGKKIGEKKIYPIIKKSKSPPKTKEKVPA